MQEAGDPTTARCDNSPPNPTVPSTRWLALVSQRQKEGVFSFPYAFAEEGFLGHCGMDNDVGMVLIPLKRSVISRQVVRRPLVPHFPGSAAKHCWWREGRVRG